MKLQKFEMSLLEGQSVEFEIESDNGNAYGQMPASMIVSFLNSLLGEKEKGLMQKVFSELLLETFKPVTDFIERYGLNDTPWFVRDVIEEAMEIYEDILIKYYPDIRFRLWFGQKQRYFGW